MKKLLFTFLALFLCVTLTACGNGDTKEEENKDNKGTEEVEKKDKNEEKNDSKTSSSEKIDLYSDDTKMVFKNGQNQLIYYYSGDKITAYHAYIDYETPELANYALTLLEKDDSIDKMYTNGRYLVVEYAKSEYENLTVAEVKALYSYLEQVQQKD